MALQLGFSPLPYYVTPEGFRPDLAPPLTDIMRVIADAGFAGLPAEIPSDMTPEAYLGLLAEYGLAPAPGYFQADFSDDSQMPQVIHTAREMASAHKALGLDHIFLAQQYPNPERLLKPAQGAGADPARLARIIANISAITNVITECGLLPCFHPHVGSLIETPEEIEALLGSISADKLLFGPDVGHLAWAGGDPLQMLERYEDRIGAVHLKDIHLDIARQGREQGWDYRQTTWAGLWAVPGEGDLEMAAITHKLQQKNIWVIAEIDIVIDEQVPDVARRAFDRLAPALRHNPAAA